MWSFDLKIFDGRELLPSPDEALKAVFDLSLADLAVVVGGGLWLVLLLLSLKSVDRRDLVTGLTYMLFMTAAGVTLVLVLPARLRGAYALTGRQVLESAAMTALAGGRWLWRRRGEAHRAPPVPGPKEA